MISVKVAVPCEGSIGMALEVHLWGTPCEQVALQVGVQGAAAVVCAEAQVVCGDPFGGDAIELEVSCNGTLSFAYGSM